MIPLYRSQIKIGWRFFSVLIAIGSFSAQATYALNQKDDVWKCASILSDPGLNQSIQFSSHRKRFRAEDWYTDEKEIEALQHLNKLDETQENKILQESLRNLLSTAFGLISSPDLQNLHELMRDFLQRGGKFLINKELDSKLGYNAAFSVSNDGEVEILIPYIELMGASAGFEINQERLVESLVHELRHYLTYTRIVKNLITRGQSKQNAQKYLTRLVLNHPKNYINHIAQLEREARNIVVKLIPRNIEGSIGRASYSTMEPLQRWIKHLTKTPEDLKLIISDPTTLKMVDAVIEEMIQFLTRSTMKEALPSSLEWVIHRYLKAIKIDGRTFGLEYFIKISIDQLFTDFQGRISNEAKEALSEVFTMKMNLQRRRIEQQLRALVSQHPDLKLNYE